MKLAEALIVRADMQKKMLSLKARINSNVLVQEGDSPSEDPNVLMIEANHVAKQLQDLILQIHLTNAQAVLADGRTMVMALVERDSLLERHKLIMGAIENCKREPDRYSAREIKWKAVIPVASLQKQAEDLSAKIREVNTKMQEANWQIDLIYTAA